MSEENIDRDEYATLLRAELARAGVGATEFARLIGVSAETVYAWQRDPGAPNACEMPGPARVVIDLLVEFGDDAWTFLCSRADGETSDDGV